MNNQDLGCTVEVEAQSILAIRLSENPPTGYRWGVETAGGLELVGEILRKLVVRLGQEAWEYSSFAH